MTLSPVDLLRETADRLQALYGVDAGLADAIAAAEQANTPDAVSERAETAIRRRLDALSAARKQLKRLQGDLAQLRDVFPFSPGAWESARDNLLSTNPDGGLDLAASWLEHWFDACCRMRLDTLRYLEAEGPRLGPGFAPLVERAVSARKALARQDWQLASPMLSIGQGGLQMSGHQLPGVETRSRLRLVLTRLSLTAGSVDVYRPTDDDNQEQTTATSLALKAWHARLAGDEPAAARYLEEARGADATNLDVALQLVIVARNERRFQAALDCAEEAIEALHSLVDISNTLAELVCEVPAEFWVAVSVRALTEGNHVLALDALDKAEASATEDEHDLLAVVFETKADVLKVIEPPRNAEMVTALTNAGIHLLWSVQPDRAREYLEEAFRLNPNGADTRFALADCLRMVSAALPFGAAQPLLERALELVVEMDRTSADLGRAYRVEAVICAELARAARPERVGKLERALFAYASGVAHQPDFATGWVEVAEAASDLKLLGIADVLSEYAIRMDRNVSAVGARIRSLSEQGRYQESSALLDESTELFETEIAGWASGWPATWASAIRGSNLLWSGDPTNAARILGAVTSTSGLEWVSENLIVSLLLSGDVSDAVDTATGLVSAADSNPDEFKLLEPAVYAAVALDDLDRAFSFSGRELAGQVGQPSGRAALARVGMVQALLGEKELSLATLRTYLEEATSQAKVEDWMTIDRAILERLLPPDGPIRSSLADMDQLVAARLSQLPRTTDPFDELRQLAALGVESPGRLDLVAALVHLAKGDRASAASALEAQRHTDAAIDQLYEYAARAAPVDVSSPGPEKAAGTEPSSLTLVLPPSWFDGHPNPLEDHGLFLRFIPEMRERAAGEVPGINVRTDAVLEPGGYQVQVGDAILEEGFVDPDLRYAAPDVVAALDEVAEQPSNAPPGLVPLRGIEDRVDIGLVDLMTMTPSEVVARRVGVVADAAAEAISYSGATTG